jgi:hypothetical protein
MMLLTAGTVVISWMSAEMIPRAVKRPNTRMDSVPTAISDKNDVLAMPPAAIITVPTSTQEVAIARCWSR